MRLSVPVSFLVLLLFGGGLGKAEVKLNPLFSDGAVLQREKPIPVWGTASEGEKVKVEFDGETQETVAKEGKWRVNLKARDAGGPHEMRVSGENVLTVKDLLVGEVWLASGQSNMAWIVKQFSHMKAAAEASENPQIRFCTVPKRPSVKPEAEAELLWKAASPATTPQFSAVAYFFARDLQAKLGVPVGIIVSAYGGTGVMSWISIDRLKELSHGGPKAYEKYKKIQEDYPAAVERYEGEIAVYTRKKAAWGTSPAKTAYEKAHQEWVNEAKLAKAENRPSPPRPKEPEEFPREPRPPSAPYDPSSLFNGMIHPLIPYALRGVIWYQGENDAGSSAMYRQVFPEMVRDWRGRFELGEIPFLYVQIAPFHGMTPEIREAQLQSLQTIPNSAMVVTTDVGDGHNIHPVKKEPVGERLALAALALAYGKPIEYSGPLYKEARFEGGKAVVSFTHLGSGLEAREGALKGFVIAGTDQNFLPATAEIQGENVIVFNENIKEPTAVRYGWERVPDVNLFNREGLPASPFRSDFPQ